MAGERGPQGRPHSWCRWFAGWPWPTRGKSAHPPRSQALRQATMFVAAAEVRPKAVRSAYAGRRFERHIGRVGRRRSGDIGVGQSAEVVHGVGEPADDVIDARRVLRVGESGRRHAVRARHEKPGGQGRLGAKFRTSARRGEPAVRGDVAPVQARRVDPDARGLDGAGRLDGHAAGRDANNRPGRGGHAEQARDGIGGGLRLIKRRVAAVAAVERIRVGGIDDFVANF